MKRLIGNLALMLTVAVTPFAVAQDKGAAQSYPAKPIRLIVPQAPGGSNDIMARYIGYYLTERLGRQVVVDNRPGADAIIGTDIAARSAPDGYTLLMVSAAYTTNPAVRKVPYDPLTAFDWVANPYSPFSALRSRRCSNTAGNQRRSSSRTWNRIPNVSGNPACSRERLSIDALIRALCPRPARRAAISRSRT